MLFMGQEVGETLCFSFDDAAQPVNPQQLPAATSIDQGRILAWFVSLMGLRNDPTQDCRENPTISGGHGQPDSRIHLRRAAVFVCGGDLRHAESAAELGLARFALQDGLQGNIQFFVAGFPSGVRTGKHQWRLHCADLQGQILNLPAMGAVVLQRV